MRKKKRRSTGENDFLWLVSLSDLMILLFVFFVVLFSFSAKKLSAMDLQDASAVLRGEKNRKNKLEDLKVPLHEMLVTLNLDKEVDVEAKEHELTINIREKFLFESGQYEVNPEGAHLIEGLAQVMAKIPSPYHLGIEGHTDDVPIKTKTVSDNWELSSKRAHSVLVGLNLPQPVLARTVMTGYAEMQPLVSNHDEAGIPLPENRAKNRRVTLRVF